MHRRVSHYPISKLVYKTLQKTGLKPSVFVGRLGYRNAGRGVKRLDEWLLTGQGPAFLLEGLPSLGVSKTEIIKALSETAQLLRRELNDSILGRPLRRLRKMKPGVRHTCECEHVVTSVEGQTLHGIVYYYGSADLDVMITSPFEGFTKGLHLPYFARTVYPDGYKSPLGYKRAKQLLKAIYLERKKFIETAS